MNRQEKKLLQQAVMFHGHTGAFLAVGLKMGLEMKKYLEGDCFHLQAEVYTGEKPPRACLLDGVQVATGCTLGKGNIEPKVSEDTFAVFKNPEKAIKIEVKKEFLDWMAGEMQGRGRHDLTEITEKIMGTAGKEIFLVTELPE